MAYIKYTTKKPTTIAIPYWFITDYMPKAHSGCLKVYLYLFAESATTTSLSLEEASTKLDMLYSEVISALKYWNERKVLRFESLSEEEFELEFYFDKPHLESPSIETPKPKVIISQTRPEYRTEEINLYLQDSPEITRLFRIAEEYLGRLLTITDQKILFSFYDWLHMPFDLIEYLIEYCVSNNHRAMNYIEKVAISWIDQGINSVDKAKEKSLQDKKYYQILSALGSAKNNVTPVERNCIDKWLNTYKLSIDIVLEACKRTVIQTNNPSLKYVDSILTSWYNDKVATLEDIKSLDAARESKKGLENPKGFSTNRPSTSTKVAQFNQMYSHDWDFDELEKLEREYISRKLNGGN